MSSYSTSRVRIYRKYKRMIAALKLLLENKVITQSDFDLRRAAVDDLYSDMKRDRALSRPKEMRPIGRPRNPVIMEPSPVCKKSDCDKSVPRQYRKMGHVYCSRECAPFGFYGTRDEGSEG